MTSAELFLLSFVALVSAGRHSRGNFAHALARAQVTSARMSFGLERSEYN